MGIERHFELFTAMCTDAYVKEYDAERSGNQGRRTMLGIDRYVKLAFWTCLLGGAIIASGSLVLERQLARTLGWNAKSDITATLRSAVEGGRLIFLFEGTYSHRVGSNVQRSLPALNFNPGQIKSR